MLSYKQKIEILERDNKRLMEENKKLKEQYTIDLQHEIEKFKRNEQALLDEIRKLKDKTEKELLDFYKEKEVYEEKMKKQFGIKKPLRLRIGSNIYGAEITVTCNAPHGFSPIQSYEVEVGKNETFKIYDDSDKIGVSSIDLIEIQAVNAGDIIIKNELKTLYSGEGQKMLIKNCSAGETFIINGQTLQISSDNTSHTDLANDYNYEPIQLVNYDQYLPVNTKELVEQARLNTFTNLGVPVKLNLAYRTERTAVIPT